MGFKKYQSVEKVEPVKKDEVKPSAGEKPKLADLNQK